MKRNCQLYQWYQNNPFAPSRGVFEHGSTDDKGEDVDQMADTVREPKLPDKEPITQRSPIKEEKTTPESGTQAKTEAVTDVRDAVAETLEEKVARLKRENLKKDERISELERRNEKLEEENGKDKLTNLKNRGYFDNRIKKSAERAFRYNTNFSLIFVDLDKFKYLNDELGHLVGDEALREVGRIINNSFRLLEVNCRYGGEEFAIILPETDREGAAIAAERLRKEIEIKLRSHLERIFKIDIPSEILCTASIGVSSCDPETRAQEENLVEAVIIEADSAMYKAKDSGRNTVRIHEEGVIEEGHETVIKTAVEDRKSKDPAAQMIKKAEEIMPEDPKEQEKILRKAADEIRDTLV